MNYYLGLDIGTDSVGWAVTDEKYNLGRKKGKDLWGIHLFDGGNTAEARRVFRSQTRRLMRKKQRIRLLQEIFDAEIKKVDRDFFLRLEESNLYMEDKSLMQGNALFNDEKFTDKTYHDKYPTVYHLRKELMESDEKMDIRLYYLACAHILKTRGHFLFPGKEVSDVTDFNLIFEEFNEIMEIHFEKTLDSSDKDNFREILKERITKTDKLKKLKSLESAPKEFDEIFKLMTGGKADLYKIFTKMDDQTLKEESKDKITFTSIQYEEDIDFYVSTLGEDMDVVEICKKIYDWMILADILKDHHYFSEAKIDSYDKHKKDLALLKKVIKLYGTKQTYKDMFKVEDEKGAAEKNYVAYIGNSRVKNNKSVVAREDFYKYVKGVVDKFKEKDDQDIQYILGEIALETFLPKQRVGENGVVPFQLHLVELKNILEKAAKHYDFLNVVEDEKEVKDKILDIMTFRIPYYVGPLNDTHNEDKKHGHGWIVKRNKELKIRPWNFEEAVDLEASAEAFITRMTSRCSYLSNANVIPDKSLLYSKYKVLNELNNIKVNDEKVSPKLKQRIYIEVFMKRKKVTGKAVKGFLLTEGLVDKADQLSGFDRVKDNH